ncbi:MAG: hypothetical protein ACM3N4_11370 [Nitrososphaerota archaeon]
MQPEDRLDALLSLHDEAQEEHGAPPSANIPADSLIGDDDLQPLLDAAYRVAELRSEAPSPDFAARLKTRFLAQAAYLEERAGDAPELLGGIENDTTTLPPVDAPPLIAGNDDPTLPGIEWSAVDDTTETGLAAARRRTVWKRLLWPALAAALLLAIGMTTLTAAAAADPGTPFYGLRRWEQSIQVNMAGSAADRTSLHLTYARDALAALSAAATQHDTGATYDEALATFSDEMRAAMASLSSVPAGNEQDLLSSRLRQLRADGHDDLHSALVALPWSKRVATTAVLAEIGDDVLTVTQASMVDSGHGQHIWTITVSGSGFQQGAVLLVNGRPAGVVTSVTPTAIVAQISGDDSAPLPDSIGVANPDDTAAVTSHVSGNEQDDGGPSSSTTPTAEDHTGDTQSGDNHDNGSGGTNSGGNSGPGGGS